MGLHRFVNRAAPELRLAVEPGDGPIAAFVARPQATGNSTAIARKSRDFRGVRSTNCQ